MSTHNWHARACLVPLAWALAALLAALLVACGPGVGGTGTGEQASAPQPSAATPTSVCSSELAALLGCVGSGAAAAPLQGLILVDTVDGRQVQLQLQGDQVEVAVPCARLRFSGRWGANDGQPGAYFGIATVDGVPAPATMSVQLGNDGVLIQLRDAQGGSLLGPLLVVVVATPAPMACR